MDVTTLPRQTAALLSNSEDRDALVAAYPLVRAATMSLASPVSAQDAAIQSMPDVSPTRWHLAHTTWFFETFVLKTFDPSWQPVDPDYEVLFNSYYNAIGEQFPRDLRGTMTRPNAEEVLDYRAQVDVAMMSLLSAADATTWSKLGPILLVGLHHEQQHQELILTDIKHVLAQNPSWPIYREALPDDAIEAPAQERLVCPEGLFRIGTSGREFAFDNERPQHKVWLDHYRIASRCVTNGEYLQFIEKGGYQNSKWWLSLGWDTVRANDWIAPLYWVHQEGAWWQFTLHGLMPLDLNAPVCHVSYFEAEAYARFAGGRLPTESEWEHAIALHPISPGAMADDGRLQPAVATAGRGMRQVWGDVWEWTASPYTPYPGYVVPKGAVGEYNGKFMCQQYVLRGGSCATPSSHIRPTYRNFFPPDARWQFSGIRLAWSDR